MKRNIILLFAGLFLVSGRLAKEKYYVVMWDKADISQFLSTQCFDKAVFNFTSSGGGHDMSVTGFDVYEKLIHTWALTRKSKKIDLDNAYLQGLFFLSGAKVQAYSANGTKSLYFLPVAYNTDYVGYEIYDVDPSTFDKDSSAFVTKLGALNPSPPRNP
ncbi:MAG TPA: hypothetical protein VNS50_04810 [Ginsengibacter sp.]|nr:hypothetical protein [Ginsengibacter sp.]